MAMLFEYKRMGEKIGKPVRIGSCIRVAYTSVWGTGTRGSTTLYVYTMWINSYSCQLMIL